MLDTDEKISAIKKVINERAESMKNKKLKLHTFLCYNISLKSCITKYLSPRPDGY